MSGGRYHSADESVNGGSGLFELPKNHLGNSVWPSTDLARRIISNAPYSINGNQLDSKMVIWEDQKNFISKALAEEWNLEDRR